jgi:hypothetical protein
MDIGHKTKITTNIKSQQFFVVNYDYKTLFMDIAVYVSKKASRISPRDAPVTIADQITIN